MMSLYIDGGIVLRLVESRLVILVVAASWGMAVYSDTTSKVAMKRLSCSNVKRSYCWSSMTLMNWKVSFGMCLLL